MREGRKNGGAVRTSAPVWEPRTTLGCDALPLQQRGGARGAGCALDFCMASASGRDIVDGGTRSADDVGFCRVVSGLLGVFRVFAHRSPGKRTRGAITGWCVFLADGLRDRVCLESVAKLLRWCVEAVRTLLAIKHQNRSFKKNGSHFFAWSGAPRGWEQLRSIDLQQNLTFAARAVRRLSQHGYKRIRSSGGLRHTC